MRWKSTVGGRFFCGGSEGVDVGPLRVGRQFPASLAFDWSRENTLELSNDKKSPSKKSTNSISPQVLVTTWLKVLRFTKQLRKSGGFFLEGGFLFFKNLIRVRIFRRYWITVRQIVILKKTVKKHCIARNVYFVWREAIF